MRALALLLGTAMTLSASPGCAMESEEFLKLSGDAQAAYVAGVVDAIVARRLMELLDKNANATASELQRTPFIRCVAETTYGMFRSATLDALRVQSPPSGNVALVVGRVIARLCPPDW